jgi:Na+-transporting NADH:ubiquinone oxidoreductase subunit B
MRHAKTTALTPGAPHVRDGVDLRWVMRTVLVALAPCIAVGLYNTGYQANRALLEHGLEPGSGWRDTMLAWVGAGRDASSDADCILLGVLHFVPLLAIALMVGAGWERIFAAARHRSLVPGLSVTACLFTASLPPTLPWWQAALGISFGVVVGKEIFGGTGRNVFNPAVVGLAFLYFAYPADMRGQGIWVAVDATTGPTALRIATAGGAAALADQGTLWVEAFLGRIPGAMAETSKLGCILGALYLVHQRVASWRVMLGVLLGAAATGALLPGPAPGWHLVLGSLAFGAVFLATDPVTSAATDVGRWIYGLLIGFLVVLIRVTNPVHTEGVLLAILLGNIAAPLIDHGVIRLHVLKRRRRLGRT